MAKEAANHDVMKAVNTLRDSLNVALGSGSDAESAMTWRSGEQDLQQPFALPYGYRTPKESLPDKLGSLANADFIMAVQMVSCSRP